MTAEHQSERTQLATEEEHDPDPVIPTPGREPRPWIVVGLVFLILFIAILAWAVIRPIA
jgi:hypothetical protein